MSKIKLNSLMPAEQKENKMVIVTDKVNYEKELKRLLLN